MSEIKRLLADLDAKQAYVAAAKKLIVEKERAAEAVAERVEAALCDAARGNERKDLARIELDARIALTAVRLARDAVPKLMKEIDDLSRALADARATEAARIRAELAQKLAIKVDALDAKRRELVALWSAIASDVRQLQPDGASLTYQLSTAHQRLLCDVAGGSHELLKGAAIAAGLPNQPTIKQALFGNAEPVPSPKEPAHAAA
jgi:hypothetical protein